MSSKAPSPLTPRQAADALSIGERTLWRLTAPRGPLPSVRIGRSVRYAISDLDAWIAASRQVPNKGETES